MLEISNSSAKKILSRINSVYIHRLDEIDVINLIEKLAELIGIAHSKFSITQRDFFIPEFLQLARSLFIRYSLKQDIGISFYNCVKKNSFGDRHLGYFLSFLEILLRQGASSSEFSDLVPAAKRKILYDADDSRIFTAKFLIEFLKHEKNEKSKNELRDYLMNYCNDRCPKVRKIIIEGIEEFFEEEKSAPLEHYDLFTDLTQNSDVLVRLAALRIVKMYTQFFPEE